MPDYLKQAMVIVGIPGSGKTSLVREVMAGVPWEQCQHEIMAYIKYPGGVELGARREGFSGTDALPMNVQKTAESFIKTCDAIALIAEGDRLGNEKFLHALSRAGWLVTLVWLDCPTSVAMLRRWDRDSRQNKAWLTGRATKIQRLARAWRHACWKLDARQPLVYLAQTLRGHPVLTQLRQDSLTKSQT